MPELKLSTNLRCDACVRSIQPLFDTEPGLRRWSVDLDSPDKPITVEGDAISAGRVGTLLNKKGYTVIGAVTEATPTSTELATSYFPLILILSYLVGGVLLLEFAAGVFEPMRAMSRFMAGFFLVFSFFKLLNLSAFADAYSGYDLVAVRVRGYGFVYPFLELGLGAAYLAEVWPFVVNTFTAVLMAVSTAGVVCSLLAGRKIRCACLGTVFQLPMSTVTLAEDLLMLGMAIAMLIMN